MVKGLDLLRRSILDNYRQKSRVPVKAGNLRNVVRKCCDRQKEEDDAVVQSFVWGRRAKRHRYAIIQAFGKKGQPEVYVITSPQNGENLL